ncbi:MAG TPA: amino acid transporter [Chloroflexia bacterium]|nr:amino acid transporter [Chloroflexia bacterium]
MSDTFSPVEQAASLMAGFKHPWLIAGGWAIDLHLGRVTRPHKDVDIMVFRRDQLHLWERFAGWHLYVAHSGQLYAWRKGDYLQPPLFGIWAYHPERHPPHTPDMQPNLEFLLDDLSTSGDVWRFRRNAAITLPVAQLIMRTEAGVPFLSPEIALLYKAKNNRPQDTCDFNNVREVLDEERAEWLAQALKVSLPGHEWLARL